MRIITLILSLLPLLLSAQGGEQIKNRRIKEVVTVEFNDQKTDECRKIHEWFDKKGRLIERKVFKQTGELRFHKRIKYVDRWGSNVEEVIDPNNGSIISAVISSYDRWRNLIRQEKKNDKGLVEQVKVWEYTKKGKLSKSTVLDSKGEIVMVKTFTYDFKGMIISEVITDGKGKLIESKNVEYIY